MWVNDAGDKDVQQTESEIKRVLDKCIVTGNGKLGKKSKKASPHEKPCYYAITCREHFFCFICDQAYKLGRAALTHNFRRHPLQTNHIKRLNALRKSKGEHKYAHYWETKQQTQQQTPGSDNKEVEPREQVANKESKETEIIPVVEEATEEKVHQKEAGSSSSGDNDKPEAPESKVRSS